MNNAVTIRIFDADQPKDTGVELSSVNLIEGVREVQRRQIHL